MSGTNENHTKFWRRMSELFGRKWLDEYGSECPVSWREVIDKYTARELKAGLDLLRTRTSEFLPTLPEVSQVLERGRARMGNLSYDPAELRRGYWRSDIISQVSRGLGYNDATFEPVLLENRHSLGASMLQLLDEACDHEASGGRTKALGDMVSQRCREIVATFNRLKAAVDGTK